VSQRLRCRRRPGGCRGASSEAGRRNGPLTEMSGGRRFFVDRCAPTRLVRFCMSATADPKPYQMVVLLDVDDKELLDRVVASEKLNISDVVRRLIRAAARDAEKAEQARGAA